MVAIAPGSDVSGLLAELSRRGFRLLAVGGRLQIRPGSAMTPDLLERVKAHKPGLLALIATVGPTATHYIAEECRVLESAPAELRATLDRLKSLFPGAEVVSVRPPRNKPAGADEQAAEDVVKWYAPCPSAAVAPTPFDDELEDRPAPELPKGVLELVRPRDGWTPPAWRNRLLQMALRCGADHPERAAELRHAAIVMTPALAEVFEERAAIMEYDGGVSRELAEAAAATETVRNIGNQEKLAISQVLCYSSNHGGRTERDSESD
jgi:hypothetical protein